MTQSTIAIVSCLSVDPVTSPPTLLLSGRAIRRLVELSPRRDYTMKQEHAPETLLRESLQFAPRPQRGQWNPLDEG